MDAGTLELAELDESILDAAGQCQKCKSPEIEWLTVCRACARQVIICDECLRDALAYPYWDCGACGFEADSFADLVRIVAI